MEDKENQMQETIGILETESKKIFDIVEEKEFLDEEVEEMRANALEHL